MPPFNVSFQVVHPNCFLKTFQFFRREVQLLVQIIISMFNKFLVILLELARFEPLSNFVIFISYFWVLSKRICYCYCYCRMQPFNVSFQVVHPNCFLKTFQFFRREVQQLVQQLVILLELLLFEPLSNFFIFISYFGCCQKEFVVVIAECNLLMCPSRLSISTAF